MLDKVMAVCLIVVLVISTIIIFMYKRVEKSTLDHRVPTIHVVKKGETLCGISKKYYPELDYRGVVAVLRELNGIDNPGMLQVGDKILLK